MAEFTPALETILEAEGGYVLTDHTGDRGGQTYAGISRRANPDWPGWEHIDAGTTADPALRGQVEHLYRSRYWRPIHGDDIPSDRIARAVFSCAVLSGPTSAIRLAQMVFGIDIDGIVGPKTLDEFKAIQVGTGAEQLFGSLYALARIARYSEICKRDPEQIGFLRGWINRAILDA